MIGTASAWVFVVQWGALVSVERIAPAGAMFVLGFFLLSLAWRGPHRQGGKPVRPPDTPPSGGGDQYNINQQGGTAQQNNYFNQSPEPEVTSIDLRMKNERNPRNNLYVTSYILTIKDPYAVEEIEAIAVAPSIAMTVVGNENGVTNGGHVGRASSESELPGRLSSTAKGPFQSKIHVAAHTEEPESVVQFSVMVRATSGKVILWVELPPVLVQTTP